MYSCRTCSARKRLAWNLVSLSPLSSCRGDECQDTGLNPVDHCPTPPGCLSLSCKDQSNYSSTMFKLMNQTPTTKQSVSPASRTANCLRSASRRRCFIFLFELNYLSMPRFHEASQAHHDEPGTAADHDSQAEHRHNVFRRDDALSQLNSKRTYVAISRE